MSDRHLIVTRDHKQALDRHRPGLDLDDDLNTVSVGGAPVLGARGLDPGASDVTWCASDAIWCNATRICSSSSCSCSWWSDIVPRGLRGLPVDRRDTGLGRPVDTSRARGLDTQTCHAIHGLPPASRRGLGQAESAGGKRDDRLPEMAADLVRHHVAVIATPLSTQAVIAVPT